MVDSDKIAQDVTTQMTLMARVCKWRRRFFTLLLVICIIFFANSFFGQSIRRVDYIANIPINGIITENWHGIQKIENIENDKNAKAAIIYINSPGGTITGSESFYNSIMRLKKKKPVVVTLGSVAASGGYFVSLASDYIISHNGTLTGSIGVLYPSFDVTGVAEKIGVKFHNYRSSSLKAYPLPTDVKSQTSDKHIDSLIRSYYQYFSSLVKERRNISKNNMAKVLNGAAYTGIQALDLGLVDEIGDYKTAISWLAKNHQIDKELPLIEISLQPKKSKLERLLELKAMVGDLLSSATTGPLQESFLFLNQ